MRTHSDRRGGGDDHMATVLLSKSDELAITRAMMLGCSFQFYDYGHPERARVRKYWRCVSGSWPTVKTGFGHDQVEAAKDYLRRYHPELL